MRLNFLSKYFLSKLYLFAGQGTQQKGMLAPILPKLQSFDYELLKNIKDDLKMDLIQIGTTDFNQQMNLTEVTQPLLLLSHYFYFRNCNLEADDCIIGHSLGEYSALVVSGSLTINEGLRLVQKRGALMTQHTTSPHGMLIATIKDQFQFKTLLSEHHLEIACYNTKENIIVGGPKEELLIVKQKLKILKIPSIMLPVSTAFHCSMLLSMQHQFKLALEQCQFKEPKCRIIRNCDCQNYNKENIIEGLIKQLTNPVMFYQSVLKLPIGTQIIEIGHKSFIKRFAQKVMKEKQTMCYNQIQKLRN